MKPWEKEIKQKGLRIWNEVIQKAIKEKQNVYQSFLQRKCNKTEKAYEEERNKVKAIKELCTKCHRKFLSVKLSRMCTEDN